MMDSKAADILPDKQQEQAGPVDCAMPELFAVNDKERAEHHGSTTNADIPHTDSTAHQNDAQCDKHQDLPESSASLISNLPTEGQIHANDNKDSVPPVCDPIQSDSSKTEPNPPVKEKPAVGIDLAASSENDQQNQPSNQPCENANSESPEDGKKLEESEMGEDMDEDMEGIEDEEGKREELPFEQRARHVITGRGVTLAMLMADGFIQPGDNTMSIDYLGQKFTADLLEGGRIRENGKVFGSPSAWAIHCKKIVNPTKKSGCGWASVKYKGKKLDAYKSSWFRKQRPLALAALGVEEGEDCESSEGDRDESPEEKTKPTPMAVPAPVKSEPIPPEPVKMRPLQPLRPSVRHSTLGKKCSNHDSTILVECVPFVAMAKIQPFTISVSRSCEIIMDFHSHLMSSEVVGYLGGKWDSQKQHLSIQRAYPCLCQLKDTQAASSVEDQIRKSMAQHGVSLVGWYHSHPKSQPDPSLNDIESQMEYQLQLRGPNNTYHPCLGLIVSPFEPWSSSPISRMRGFWVMPPPEHRPLDYGMPMFMEFNESQDSTGCESVVGDLGKIVDFYKGNPDLISFSETWFGSITNFDKMKESLAKRCPSSCDVNTLMNLVRPLKNNVKSS